VTGEGKRRAAIYVRISQDREGRELGVRRQEEDCRALADRLDWTVVRVYPDNDVSASAHSRKPRKQYEAMLAAVDAGEIDGILAYSTSRLTRRPLELEGLVARVEHGLRIATVAAGQVDLSTANGRAMARTLAAFDAREADENSERSKRERQQRREQGRWHGGRRPFGWEPDGTTPRPAEQQLIRDAARAVLNGRSLGSIARDWTAALGPWRWRPGWQEPNSRIRASMVGDVLRNPRLAGMLPDGRPAKWRPVLDEAMWRGVTAVLADPARRREHGPTRLLTGIGLCGVCGTTVNGGTTRDGTPTYRCSATVHLDRAADPVDLYVAEVLILYLAGERLTRPAPADTAGAFAREAAGLRARLGELADLVADGAMTAGEYRPRAERLRRELEDVERRTVAAMGASALAGLPVDEDKLRRLWADHEGDPEWRRGLLRASGLQVVVHPPGRGVRRFDPATVVVTKG
jgi:site-specific DNA recombinase